MGQCFRSRSVASALGPPTGTTPKEEGWRWPPQVGKPKAEDSTLLNRCGVNGFLGFDFRLVRSFKGKWRPQYTPKLKKRTAILAKLREIFRRNRSQPVGKVIEEINPILRGWVNYFAVGNSGRCFQFIQNWVERKIRRHMMRAQQRQGFGWKRWSTEWLHQVLGLFNQYRVRYYVPHPKVALAR